MKRITSLVLMIFLISIGCKNITFAEDKFKITMYVGEAIDLDSFLIENQVLSAEEDMSWTSGNERVINVNSNGRVEANEAGKATVYARDKNNSSKIATIKIQVVSMVESFELKNENLSIRIGEVYNIEYDIIAVDGQDKVYQDDVEWNSSYPKIVEVDEYGQIIGVKEGTAKIRAKTVDGGLKDEIFITVSGIKEDILVDNGLEEVQVFVGGQHQFSATSDGKDVTLGVEWSSGLEDVLEIDDDGVAEGKESGRTQVKAATKDKKKFDTIMVKVVSMVKEIELNHRQVSLKNIGDTIDLDYTLISAVSGMEPFENGVKWSSSNSAIARVDGEGVVTAKDKGIARITATSVDGELEAHCSITVIEDADDKEIPVGNIYLDSPVEELFVGQEYTLPIVIEPVDATEVDLKFRAKLGSSSQVKKENGDDGEEIYVFVPTESGKNEITITTESEEEFIYKVKVISPIRDVEIDTSELYEEKRKYYFYVGQKMLLNPIFELKEDYMEMDIHERDVIWKVGESDYLDIDKEAREKENDGDKTVYDYYLVGEEKGTSTLTLTSKDGDHKDEIEIKVLSSYSDLELVDEVTLPTNTKLVPEVIVTMREDLKSNLIPDVNYFIEKEFEIERQYVKIASVDEEITMEKEIILDLQKSAVNSENASVIYGEINEHKSRLSKLELVRETAKNGYCEIKDKFELKDVFGEDYIVADLDDGVITGKRDGKIELSVTFPGTKVVEKGTYYFSSDLKGIIIVNNSGEVVSVNESGFSKALTNAELKKQMELAIRVEERYGDRTDEDTPSYAYIEGILNLEALNFIPQDMKDDYKKPVSRIELAETFIGLIEYISSDTLKRPSGIDRFKDTTNKTAELAYDLGLVDLLLPTEFDPFGHVTCVTFAKAIERMTIVLDAYDYNQDKFIIQNDLGTGQKLFVDIVDVSSSNKEYIEKWAITYGIIEGSENKLYPNKSLTREEFLYYISKLVK